MNVENMNMNVAVENNLKANFNENDVNNSFNDSNRNPKKNNHTNQINNSKNESHSSNIVASKNKNDVGKLNEKSKKTDYEFEKLSVEDYGKSRKYYDLDDIVGLYLLFIFREVQILSIN
jgi:hypothetical protein